MALFQILKKMLETFGYHFPIRRTKMKEITETICEHCNNKYQQIGEPLNKDICPACGHMNLDGLNFLAGLDSIAQATEQLLVANSLSNISTEKLRALLAYKYWDESSDDNEFILSVWKTDPTWTRDRVIETLTEVFGFIKTKTGLEW